MKTYSRFVLFVALSPIVPFVLGFIAEGSCYLLHSALNFSCSSSLRSWTEAFANYGFLGWIVTLPLALALSVIGGLFKVASGSNET